jgi:putative redox protein
MSDGVWVEYPMEVVWEGGQRFRGGRPGGPTILIDGDREVAPGPVDGLIIALASCSAIDVVEILEKRRTPAARLDVQVRFARAAQAPRRVTAVRLLFRVVTASASHHVARAVELSVQKYCSVVHSLKTDVDLEWEVEVEAAEMAVE